MTPLICLLLQEIFVTVISGAVLAIAFFGIREKCFPLPAIEGRWFIETKTAKSSYRPFKDMILLYEAMLWREGNVIKGTAEKIFENSEEKQGEFVGKERTRSQVDGYIEKRYFGADRMCLHFVEQGRRRESTAFFTLTCTDKSVMSGTFDTTAGTSSGEAHVRREKEPFHFQQKFGSSAKQ